jgi:cyclopropane-fatty-acyl-phospholipid synthase
MVADRVLGKAVSLLVKRGTLEVITAKGRVFKAGDGGEPEVRIRLTDAKAVRALILDPELTLGELFVDGRLVIEKGSIFELFQLLLEDSHGDRSKLPIPSIARARELAFRLQRGNDRVRAKRNVAHHYDLERRLYELFLDSEWQYSCAYFEHPGMSLDEAQRAKQRHIAAKLLVERGNSVLEIGSGWGGLAMYLADIAGAAKVRGITLSEEQLAASRRSAGERGLSGRVAFELEDYRSTQGVFDRIVSVGMFEHVGPSSYQAYFDASARLLAEDGVMLLHTIGRTGPAAYTNPWITKYIFPGGHLPTLSQMVPAIERAGLAVTDLEVLRLHYAQTLRAWRERFMARREEAAQLYDERFCRMWECYLAMAEASFRFEDVVVFQVQLARRKDVVPLTRDYVAARENALRVAERAPMVITAQAGE